MLMPSIFDPLETPDGQPLRRTGNVKLTRDSEGNLVIELVDLETIVQTQTGSIDQIRMAVDRFYHCGHSSLEPVGGKCAALGCNRVSCRNCFSRCQRCLMPLCLEHVAHLSEEGRELILCSTCRDQIVRKHRWTVLVRAVLGPFISFDRKDTA
jgi:hypothetical protein